MLKGWGVDWLLLTTYRCCWDLLRWAEGRRVVSPYLKVVKLTRGPELRRRSRCNKTNWHIEEASVHCIQKMTDPFHCCAHDDEEAETEEDRSLLVLLTECLWEPYRFHRLALLGIRKEHTMQLIKQTQSNKTTDTGEHTRHPSMQHPSQHTGEWVNNRGWTGDRTPSFLCCYYIIIVIIIDVVVNICITGWRRISSSSLTSIIMQR